MLAAPCTTSRKQTSPMPSRRPTIDPRLADYIARLDEINQLVIRNPGSVWRYLTDSRGPAQREFEDPLVLHDVVIVGGGPVGPLRCTRSGPRAQARARVRLGPRQNAAAEHMHDFVTRDGTPPDEFRRIAREQLATYSKVRSPMPASTRWPVRAARSTFA